MKLYIYSRFYFNWNARVTLIQTKWKPTNCLVVTSAIIIPCMQSPHGMLWTTNHDIDGYRSFFTCIYVNWYPDQCIVGECNWHSLTTRDCKMVFDKCNKTADLYKQKYSFQLKRFSIFPSGSSIYNSPFLLDI